MCVGFLVGFSHIYLLGFDEVGTDGTFTFLRKLLCEWMFIRFALIILNGGSGDLAIG
jgi:hypothetical protein